MRRTFSLVHPKTKPPRLIEAAVHEVRKYMKRERKRDVPEESDFWDFDCRFGSNEAMAEPVHADDLAKKIAEAADQGWDQFFVEIKTRAAKRMRPNRAPSRKTDS